MDVQNRLCRTTTLNITATSIWKTLLCEANSIFVKFSISLSFMLLLSSYSLLVSADTTIRYPKPGENFENHHKYPLSLLELAIEKSGYSAQLIPSKRFMHQGRALKQLQANRDIEVFWSMTSMQREKDLRPIRVPIYKGLIGWRVFLTSDKRMPTQNEAIAEETLRQLVTIQGHDWPDTYILQQNGFNILSSPTYAGLFTMLSLGRADIFPRSIIEVWDELPKYEKSEIKLEQHTLISYPTASYFFVSRDNHELATAIEQGLHKAISDGSFDQLFKKHFSYFIKRSKLAERRHYRLNNPLLSQETPLDRKELWFDIQRHNNL